MNFIFIILFEIYAPKAPYPSGQVFPTVSDSERAYSMWVYRKEVQFTGFVNFMSYASLSWILKGSCLYKGEFHCVSLETVMNDRKLCTHLSP